MSISLAYSLNSMQQMVKDTSYTVSSSYLKYKKDFPTISIAEPKSVDMVTEYIDVPYKSVEKRQLLLDAYINNSKTNPAVILVHGGGWKSGNKSHMKPMAQYIASKGFSCFAIEYRLSDEAKFPNSVYDVKEAVQYIKHHAVKFNVDSSKVAVLGCSSGAQMASLVGSTNDNPRFEEKTQYSTTTAVQAIVNIDGVLAFNHPKSKEDYMASWWLGGTFNEQPENWIDASALTHTNENTPPFLFISSQYDRFQAGREEMIQILNKHNIYNQVENFPNSPHTFWLFHPWFDATVSYITTFLDKTFKEN